MDRVNEITILLVEHDDFDLLCFKRALSSVEVNYNLVVVKSPSEALDVLLGRTGKKTIQKPYLIFSDIDMPEMTGVELLAEIRGNILTQNSRMFLLSSGFREADVLKARENNVTGFMNKSNVAHGLPVTINYFNTSRMLTS